ncbi:YjgN family protein [Neisseria lisongii]|uniref:DUF898 domain-containing protein n=1 Tax=Neisseria lisongii TaxID=2912188 RepID=A0AAW5AT20_9NEIS|nr:YjgN family protein [Neisseria lisongii]MCF7530140.1 DUF898 domain-containing protein [Neisseria lisongii]
MDNNIETPMPSENRPDKLQRQRFQFHGNAGEYFQIWIVNLVLGVITLSFYAPWAKVRRLRYLYGNTALAGNRFDFTASPGRILIGRIIALILFLPFVFSSQIDPLYVLAAWGVLALAMPWLIRSSMRFLARNSKYGNSRFYFSASVGKTYWVCMKCLLVSVFSLGLLSPLALYWFKAYQLNHLHAGQLQFKLNSGIGRFYKALLLPYLLAMAAYVLMFAALFAGNDESPEIFALLFFPLYLLMLLSIVLTRAYLFRATWNGTQIGNSRISTDLKPLTYLWISVSNVLACIFTLGLLQPWAFIRMYRYKIESLSIDLSDDPQTLENQLQENTTALGEEIADVFDLDISL